MKNKIKSILIVSLSVLLSVACIVTSLAVSSHVYQKNITLTNTIRTADVTAYLWESELDTDLIDLNTIMYVSDESKEALKSDRQYIQSLNLDNKCDYIIEHSKCEYGGLEPITYKLKNTAIPGTNIKTDLTVSVPKTSEKMYAFVSFYFCDFVSTEWEYELTQAELDIVGYIDVDFNNLDNNNHQVLPQTYSDLILPNISSSWTLLESEPFEVELTGDAVFTSTNTPGFSGAFDEDTGIIYKRTGKGTRYTYYTVIDAQNSNTNDKYVHVPVFTNNQLVVNPNVFTEEYIATHLDHLYFNMTLETAYYNFYQNNPQQAYDEWVNVVDPAFTNWKYETLAD